MEELLAKTTPPLSLQAHTDDVVEEATRLLDAFPHVVQAYDARTGTSLREQVLRAAHVHDWGKAHPTWQSACQADAAEPGGRHLMKAQLRHEFASLMYAKQADVPLSEAEEVAIAAHHGKLSSYHQHRWEEDAEGDFASLWKMFYSRHYAHVLSRATVDATLDKRYRLAGVRSLLRLADTRASRKEGGGWLPDPNALTFEYSFPYRQDDGSPSFRGVQRVTNQHTDRRELLLRAPTGSGKTDSALLWAQAQIDDARADRCVIAMPTRFTSTALATGAAENVGQTGLYHSSAWHSYYAGSASDDDRITSEEKEEQARAEELHRMARLLMTPLTVCTVDHLLIALTGMREDHHAVFFNLTNACVVFDEADFYDPFVQANLKVLLQVLRHFEVPVLIMSATVPDAAKNLYAISEMAEDTSDLDRVRCTIRDAGEANEPADVNHLMQQVADAPAAIVYANTVKRALQYYDALCASGRDPILYHSRFTEPDKKAIETRLVDALGSQSWTEERAGGIAILTQIGEMSLNVSAPLMVSELCPWDRLAQRAGRLSRFEGMAPGTLHVITPTKDDELYPAPYGEYDTADYAWKPGAPLLKTRDTLEEKDYTARDFIERVDALYPDVDAFSPTSPRIERNRKTLQTYLTENWMLLPKTDSNDDEGRAKEWKSRDIPPQETVLTRCPHDFYSYGEYRAFELSHSVACPAYQIETGKKKKRVHEVPFHIGDEEESAFYAPVYSSTEGLILDMERERSTKDRCL